MSVKGKKKKKTVFYMSLSLKARKNPQDPVPSSYENDRPHLTPASSPLTNSTNDKLGGTQPSKQFTLLLWKSTSSPLAKESRYHL